MKKIIIFCLVIVILLSVGVGIADTNNSNTQLPYPKNIPSSLSPFDYSTVVRWTPYMVDDVNSFENLATSGPFGPITGKQLTLYGTLLPMTPNETRLSYSLKVLNLEGPSNVSLIFKVELSSVTSNGFATVTSFPINKTVLNTAVNRSVSGSVNLDVCKGLVTTSGSPYEVNPYSYANIMQNISTSWAYSLITLQPLSDNNSIAWNHNLAIEIHLSGFEDKAFFNYMRTEKGFNAWKNSDFVPLNIPQSIYADNQTEQIYLQPESQPSITNLSQSQLVYLSNTTNFGSKILQVNIEANATNDYKIHFSVLRGIYLDGFGFTFKEYTFITSVLSNEENLIIQVPWQKFSGLNLTVTSVNKTERFVNTTEGSYQTDTGNGNYFILNKVEISFESVNGPWDMWLTSQVRIKWLNNVELPSDTMNVTIDQKSYLLDFTSLINKNTIFDMASMNKTSNLSFNSEFLTVAVLSVIVIIKKLKFKSKPN